MFIKTIYLLYYNNTNVTVMYALKYNCFKLTYYYIVPGRMGGGGVRACLQGICFEICAVKGMNRQNIKSHLCPHLVTLAYIDFVV